MLDLSLPKISVLMVKPNVYTYPKFALQEGFRFSGYRPGMEEDWARIQYGVSQTDSFQEARDIFKRDFLSHPDLLAKQCLFVLEPGGKAVAAASLWPGTEFGQTHLRFHKIACLPDYQGYGLMKALLTKLLDIYNEINNDGFLYLTSKTHSYKAINIYKKFGFEPYLGEKPANWPVQNYDTVNPAAWKMIQDRIDAYKTGKKVFSVHNATVADSHDFADIICASWKAAYAGIISPEELTAKTDVEKRAAFFEKEIAAGQNYFYLAFDGDNPCGACSVRKSRDKNLPDWGEIVALYILKEYWGSGVGKLLMETVLAELKRMGYQNVFLWTFEKNARARRFYEKYGFVFDSTYKDSGLKDREKTREVRYRISLI